MCTKLKRDDEPSRYHSGLASVTLGLIVRGQSYMLTEFICLLGGFMETTETQDTALFWRTESNTWLLRFITKDDEEFNVKIDDAQALRLIKQGITLFHE